MKWGFCFLVLMTLATNVQSQSKWQSPPPEKKQRLNMPAKAAADSMFFLQSTGNYPAKIFLNNSSPLRLNISDPILREMDARANGATVNFNSSGIIGMPKHAYGFADGHFSLKTTGATTSGTQTGSGSVGTGTSLGTFGSAGPAMGVNGKSPYAGTVMWGNAFNLYMPVTDSLPQMNRRQNQ